MRCKLEMQIQSMKVHTLKIWANNSKKEYIVIMMAHLLGHKRRRQNEWSILIAICNGITHTDRHRVYSVRHSQVSVRCKTSKETCHKRPLSRCWSDALHRTARHRLV